jgi:plastocyanin
VSRLIALLCLVALAGPGAATAAVREVRTSVNTFQPRTLHVLVGDQVSWFNQSFTDDHNLVGPTFSELLAPREQWLNPDPFTSTGPVDYVCTIHPGMAGTIAVHDVYLRPFAAAVLYGNAMGFSGLAPSGSQVQIERLVGGVWTAVGAPVTATGADVFSAPLKPAVPGSYRAATASGESDPITVKVKPRVALTKRRLTRKRTRVTVTATPNRAGAVAVLQRRKPAGWAAIASKRLGTSSKAAFVVRPPKGTWRVRAIVKASGGYAAGLSAIIAVKR